MDKKVKYKISRRKVRYPRLEFKTGQLVIIAPYGLEVLPLIEKHKNWISNKTKFIYETRKEVENEKLARRNEETFRALIKQMTEKARKILKVTPRKISFRLMKTKWASCSKRKNLILNSLLRHLPEHLVWYVVFHEFCHLIIPRHNKKFWILISKKFDNPEKLERKLFGYWFLIWKKVRSKN